MGKLKNKYAIIFSLRSIKRQIKIIIIEIFIEDRFKRYLLEK
tara:strand:+ start:4792 stop:4917 length:126 start_codon:yes stop_codon:yes gene_type:complete